MSQSLAVSLIGINAGARATGTIPISAVLTTEAYATAVGGVALKLCPLIGGNPSTGQSPAFPGASAANLPRFFDGSALTGYLAKFTVKFQWSVGASDLTSIVVASTGIATVTTVTAHGLSVGDQVRVSGATVDTDLNSAGGTYYTVLSVPSSTTFTFLTVGVSAATYNEATLVVSLPNTSPTPAAITCKLWNGTTEIADGNITQTIQVLVPLG